MITLFYSKVSDSTNSSDCGPLTNGIKGILPIDEDNVAWNIVKYIFKPGFITVIIITLWYEIVKYFNN